MSVRLTAGDKVVLSTAGTHGDVFPFIAIAKRLQARGMRPVIATSDYYRPLVEWNGLAFCAVAPDEAQLTRDLGAPFEALIKRAMHTLSGPKFGITKVVLPYLDQAYAQLDAACEGAALLISHSYSFAAPLLAERRRVQWRSVCLQPLSFLSPFDPAVLSEWVPVHRLQRVLGPERYGLVLRGVKAATRSWFGPVDTLRRRLGLAADDRHPLFDAQFAPAGVFAMFDPILMPDRRGLPANVSVVGFGHSDGTDGRLSGPLRHFLKDGAPPMVFTLGSSAVHNPGRFYEVASASCLRLGQRAVFLCGNHTFASALPPSQLALPWASHAALFPKARVVVHQGGMGTCGQALRAGVPQLVLPFANDQPDNAARLQSLGVALSMRSWRMKESAMSDALALLQAEPSFADNARTVMRALMPEDGADTVANLLTSGAGNQPMTPT